jgi:transcriptional regulator with XRE-family HTH domain
VSAQVAATIRTELARQGLRQSDLAQRLNRSEIWVSRRLSARSNSPITFKLTDLEEIARALDISTMDLFRDVA